MGVIEKIKLALRLKRLRDQYDKETKMGYDVNKSLKKGALSFAITGGSVALAALLGYAADESAMKALFENAGVSTALVAAAVPALTALSRIALNWVKNYASTPYPKVPKVTD